MWKKRALFWIKNIRGWKIIEEKGRKCAQAPTRVEFFGMRSGKTNAEGKYNLRGFYGDYEITAEKDGKTKTVSVPCRKGNDNTITIVLDW